MMIWKVNRVEDNPNRRDGERASAAVGYGNSEVIHCDNAS
jgi:hypothetical protein